MDVTEPGEQRLQFTGQWPAWLGLVLVNWLLTFLTLGIFRFWARTRERRQLWAATQFGDEPLEYTGVGRELLVGAILAFLVLIVPLVLASLASAVAKGIGLDALALGINLAVYAVVLWLVQFAVWRAMRYRLSRTRWSGIRGAMTGSAAAYALLAIKMLALQIVTLGFAAPYAAARLFNARWSDARLGSMPVVAAAPWRPLMRVFLGSWALGLLVLAGFAVLQWPLIAELRAMGPGGAPLSPELTGRLVLTAIGALVIVGLIMLRYYAAQWQALVGGVSLDGLRLGFAATAGDWLRYWLGNGFLVLFTLGIGVVMLPWRRWRFIAGHIITHGAIDIDRLAQTRIEGPLFGEGLADALDVGAL
jgi:uncharacterized membrane protein YjgN (DUF898 family)